jgi:hypothetical protein
MFLSIPNIPRGAKERSRTMLSSKLGVWANDFFGGRSLVLQSCRVLEISLDLCSDLMTELHVGNLVRCHRTRLALFRYFMHLSSLHHLLVDFYNFSYMSIELINSALSNSMFYCEGNLNRILDYELDF